MTRPLNRPMITLSIMLATIMQTLDSTIANVALPHMLQLTLLVIPLLLLIRAPSRAAAADIAAQAAMD